MFVHVGKDLYGKTDHVPGLFYVATEFVHISAMPFIPLGSFLVVDGSQHGKNFQGQKIPLQWKSVLMGYARAWLGAAAMGCLVAGIFCIGILFKDAGRDPSLSLVLIAALALAALLAIAMLLRSWYASILLGLLVLAALAATVAAPSILAGDPRLQAQTELAWWSVCLLNVATCTAVLVRATHFWYPARYARAKQLAELLALPAGTIDAYFPNATEIAMADERDRFS